MATQNGTNYAKAVDPSPSNILDPGLNGARVRAIFETFTFAGESAGEVIRIGKLPVGAQPIMVILNHAAMGSGVTFKVGDAQDSDRYLAAVSVSSAGQKFGTIGIGDEVTGDQSNDDQIVLLTTAGAAATGKVDSVILYTTD